MKTYLIKVEREFNSFNFMMKSENKPTQSEMETVLESKYYVDSDETGLEMLIEEVID